MVEADPDVRPALAAAVVGSGWDLHEMTPLTVSLEDVFLNLVTSDAVTDMGFGATFYECRVEVEPA